MTCQVSELVDELVTIVVEDLHSRFDELHGRCFQILFALVKTSNDLIKFRLSSENGKASHGSSHKVLHPALRSCTQDKRRERVSGSDVI